MPNLAKLLKDEISRIARKEAKAAVTRFRKPTVKARKTIAALKMRLALLEKESKRVQGLLKVQSAAQHGSPGEEAAGTERITAKGMRSLRRKLRLSQALFAKLVGVTTQAVYNWEKKQGALRVRKQTKAAILSVRGIGAREARARLAEKPAARRGQKRR